MMWEPLKTQTQLAYHNKDAAINTNPSSPNKANCQNFVTQILHVCVCLILSIYIRYHIIEYHSNAGNLDDKIITCHNSCVLSILSIDRFILPLFLYDCLAFLGKSVLCGEVLLKLSNCRSTISVVGVDSFLSRNLDGILIFKEIFII